MLRIRTTLLSTVSVPLLSNNTPPKIAQSGPVLVTASEHATVVLSRNGISRPTIPAARRVAIKARKRTRTVRGEYILLQ